MQVNENVLAALDEYHDKSLKMQRHLYDKTEVHTRETIDDDLIYHVPIYDMLERKYASFSSFPEALDKRELDPKGNGVRFKDHQIKKDEHLFQLLYLFRLCGSGINYKPGSHGFGNFWIVKLVENGVYSRQEWLDELPLSQFSDNKGYIIPQFKIGLRRFILDHSTTLVDELYNLVSGQRLSIKEFVKAGNDRLVGLGFHRQTFVLSAFAADVAEYFPEKVDPNSMIHAGTNAKRCIKAIFGRCNDDDAIAFLSERYQSRPYSVEDSRLCDPVRYFLEFQSKYHIEANNGTVFKNNSILKKLWGQQEYQSFQLQLQT